jgi:rubrerythrin
VDDTVKRISEGLAKAMQAEHEGHHFYKMAARNTQDARGKEVFLQFADEEMDHFNFLKTQYKAILETGKIDPSVKLGRAKAFTGEHPIFSPDIKSRIGSAHYEMTAISIGIQLELSAVNFYKAEAEATDDAVAKAFYGELMEWEKGHLEAFRSQAESLKEEYWDKGGFSPF